MQDLIRIKSQEFKGVKMMASGQYTLCVNEL